jgi:hypothetical protein
MLTDRLDDACRENGLEWLALPFGRNIDAWRNGPHWGALLVEDKPTQLGRSRHSRYHVNEHRTPVNKLPDPGVVFITLQPHGRRAIKRLLLAQLSGERHNAIQRPEAAPQIAACTPRERDRLPRGV